MVYKEGSPLYRNGRHYDRMAEKVVSNDLSFWLKQVDMYGGPVLELGAGTGRVAIPIAEKGVKITGLDVSESMLSHSKDKAKDKGLEIEWVLADCRDFDLDKKFKLIIFPFNAFHHILDLDSVESFFRSMQKHLSGEGRLILDLFNPSLKMLTRDPDQRHPMVEYEDPDGRGKITVTESPRYDRAAQIQHLKVYYKIGDQEDAEINEWKMRIYYPQELDALIKYNGFEIEHKYGNYDETPFQSESPKQLVVCSKQR